MSFSEKTNNFDSLTKRSFGISVLTFLSQKEEISFGGLMEKLKISKRGLFLTLKDLEIDKLIIRSKKGRFTYIKISPEGRNAISNQKHQNYEKTIIEKTIDNTIKTLEIAGLISPEWDKKTKSEFLTKIKENLILSLKGINNNE